MDFGDLYEAGQRSRIELLTLELDLAFNFARLSQQYRDPSNRQRAFQCAQIAVGAVRRFEGQISDPAAWRLIHVRADELESLLEQIDKAV